ncbi:MAG TPA: hypothetical protein VH498_08150 [Candidatus Dormibacteraeota bacterium]|nr:hypothetical protein [Candidatus Dormibacteraeota bacterium]
MAKYMLLYHAPESAREMMANITPEQAKAGMELWGAWMEKNKGSITDLGAPLAGSKSVRRDSVADADNSTVSGYTLLEAASPDAVVKIVQDHPHFQTPGDASIEVFEVLAIPGM